jgi:hypothetical protein
MILSARAVEIEAAKDHWAWSSLEQSAPPEVKGRPLRSAIDHFVFSALQRKALTPAPEADPGTLLRRLFIDLIGLPPTPKEQRAFLESPSDEAYAKIVDDLLSRPQYGERWGRHWLDVVRYAESKGYERDEYKKFVWRYRDYVIEAFNKDMPYNRFIMEQLAGDELDNVTVKTQIATTFLGLGPFDTIAADGEVARYDTLDDIVGTTSMAFLGQTLQCARCHDHKFEPLSQKDYYRVLAAFESLDVTKKERPLGTAEDHKRHREAEERFKRESLEPQREVEARAWLPILQRIRKEGLPEGKKPRLTEKQLNLAIEALTIEPKKRSKEHRHILERERNRVRGAVRDVVAKEEREAMAQEEKKVKELESQRPQPMMGWVYLDSSSRPKATQLRIRGEVHQKGEEVAFALPVVLDRGGLPDPKLTSGSPGRRRALAEWITGAGAPLTARVMANRIWQYHFGRGLLPDSNNLGVSGGTPSNPDLLDWLASELIAGGWKLKPLHRTVVLSTTYRLSATHPNPGADRENEYFSRWPVHRLEAEAIRDSILAASGKLNLKMNGEPIYPPFADKVVGASSGADWKNSSDEEASRRSVYVFAKRAIPLPELAVLGNPDSSCSCAKRVISTTAVQSLLMMNGRFINEQAAHLAVRLGKTEGEEAQIRRAFELILCRSPRAEEIADVRGYLQLVKEEKKMDPLTSLGLVLFNTNEFVYRQ